MNLNIWASPGLLSTFSCKSGMALWGGFNGSSYFMAQYCKRDSSSIKSMQSAIIYWVPNIHALLIQPSSQRLCNRPFCLLFHPGTAICPHSHVGILFSSQNSFFIDACDKNTFSSTFEEFSFEYFFLLWTSLTPCLLPFLPSFAHTPRKSQLCHHEM